MSLDSRILLTESTIRNLRQRFKPSDLLSVNECFIFTRVKVSCLFFRSVEKNRKGTKHECFIERERVKKIFKSPKTV